MEEVCFSAVSPHFFYPDRCMDFSHKFGIEFLKSQKESSGNAETLSLLIVVDCEAVILVVSINSNVKVLT